MSKTIDTFLPFKQMLIPKERHAKKAPFGMSPEGLTIHEVDNNASAYNEVFFMGFNPSNINREVSYHIAVDEKESIQGIPFTRNAWHAGDGKTGFGNRSTIGMEIARNYADRATYVKARTNAEIVAGWLCYLYSWTEKDIYTHNDHSGKNCPRNIIADGYMDTFKKNAMKYKAIFAGQTDPVPNPTPTPEVGYKVGETIYYKGRVHANSMGARAGSVINGNFKINIVNNNPYGVHLAGKGWVRPGDIGKEVIQEKPTAKPDQILRVGEKFIFAKSYRVDGMKLINGAWAVYNKRLKAYITAGIVDKVDARGTKTANQVLKTGDYFTVRGTHTVERVSGNTIYPKRWGFGVDAESLYEV